MNSSNKLPNINDYLTICSKFNQEDNLDYKLILHYNPDYEKKMYIESLIVEQADYKFIMTSKSVVWHFSSRASRFPDDNIKQRPDYLAQIEIASTQKFINKWGRLPEDDDQTFVKPIYGTNVKTRL